MRPKQTAITPLDRLYRSGSIIAEQLIAGEYFAECHEAAKTGPTVPAQNLERGGTGGIARPQQERLRSVLEMISDYKAALVAIDSVDREAGEPPLTTRTVIVAVVVNRFSLDDIDLRAGRRKGWAKATLIRALNVLWGIWGGMIQRVSQV